MAGVAVEVWRIALDAMPPLEDCELAPLDAAERARRDSFLDAAAARRFVLCRLALRCLLAARGGLSAQAVPIALSAQGKPYAAGSGLPWFNLSHAARVAVVALCDDLEVGIDVEPCASFVDTARLHAAVCSPAEQDWLKRHPATADADFGRLWTRKESLLKALGTGFAISPTALDLADAFRARDGQWQAPRRPRESPQALAWRDLPPIDAHVGTVSVRTPTASASARPTLHLRDFDPAWLCRGRAAMPGQ